MPHARIVVAEADGAIIGFVTIDPQTMYLDQIVVAPEHWGAGVALALLEEAKLLSPHGIDLLVNKDNARAIRFYEKHGFAYAGEDKNPVSGKPVNRMSWRPRKAGEPRRIVVISARRRARAPWRRRRLSNPLSGRRAFPRR